MKINILYSYYFDFAKSSITIGGIQTYIQNLVAICLDLGLEVSVFQIGNETRSIEVDGYTIKELCVGKSTAYQKFANMVAEETEKENDVFIYATDTIIPWTNPFKHTIAIQHGINWDMPRSKSRPEFIMQLSKVRRNYIIMRKVNNAGTVVCVDYNFVNWLRAQSDKVKPNLMVIPNYTRIAPPFSKPSNKVNIIFARRFWWYRGTRVFAFAIKRLLNEYDNIEVTVAGSGPDEEWLHKELGSYGNLHFIRYKSEESMEIHADKHIAVVPTVGSEGTSLSLLEAMSAQCAVVASDVGGMTNIILDGYNGLLVPAGNAESLYYSIKFLIDTPSARQQIANKGYETVKCSFSYDKWKSSWEKVIKEVTQNKR